MVSGKVRTAGRAVNILVSTGEVSGDVIGANLAEALFRENSDCHVWGVGGDRMAAAGVQLVSNTNALGTVGLSEVVAILPGILRTFRAIRAQVRRTRPDVAVLIGNEGFHLLLSPWLRCRRIPTVSFFPPQIWLWRSLARPIARNFDWILTSFAEEHSVYQLAGARAVFVGHYLRDQLEVIPLSRRRHLQRSLGLDPRGRVIALLPGSRRHEIERLTPILCRAVQQMRTRDPDLQFLLAVADGCFQADVEKIVRRFGLQMQIRFCSDGRKAIAAADLTVLCSGTAALEAGLMGRPMVVLYRLSALSRMVVRFLHRTGLIDSETVALPNLLAGSGVVPEFCQDQARAESVAAEVWHLLDDGPCRRRMQQRLGSLAGQLGRPGALRRAAGVIIHIALTRRSSNHSC